MSENQVKWVPKEALFSEAVDKSIADEFIEIAGLNGYNISIMSCRERVKIAVAMVLRYVENTEQTINIPYPLVRDFSKVCPALDANRIPDKYALDKDDCDRIELALLMVIKDRLGIGHSSAALPLYSFNWFISQSQLGE